MFVMRQRSCNYDKRDFERDSVTADARGLLLSEFPLLSAIACAQQMQAQ
jgi:hypothetical protein